MTGVNDPGESYSLVMPFVVCQSKGGPFEDEAFVAGYQAGQIDRALQALATDPPPEPLSQQTTVLTALIPQLDLIAMRHGFAMTTEDSSVEGWVYAVFRRLL